MRGFDLRARSIPRRIYMGFIALLAICWSRVLRPMANRGATTAIDGFASSSAISNGRTSCQTLVVDLQRTVGDFVGMGSAEKKVEVTQRVAALRKSLDDLLASVDDPQRRERVEAIQKLGKALDANLLTLYERVTLRQEVEDSLNYDDRDVRKGLTDLIGEGKFDFSAVFDRYVLARALTVRFAATGKEETALRAEFANVGNLNFKLASEVQGADLADSYDDVTGGLKRSTEDLDRLAGALGKRTEIAATIDRLSDQMRSAAKDIHQLTAAAQDATRATAVARGAASLQWTLALSLTGFCIAGLVAFAIARSITAPLKSLGAAMSRLAQGDSEVEVAGLKRRDEIGQMAATVQVFKENARSNARLTREADARLQADRQELLRKAESDAKYIADLERFMASITQALDWLSEGDLTYRIDDAFVAEYATIRATFNVSVGKLEQAMLGVNANAVAMSESATEIASAADDLSRRTEQQAATIEETSAALAGIAAAVRKTAQDVSHAREIVSMTKSDAERGGAVVRKTIEAMSGIETASRKVSQIIGVIDEIAFQTNLLALNAGVEAARAGAAGSGFAVVAAEVRALAHRSAEAAKEIKSLIAASQGQVEQGVETVGETGKAIERIFTQVVDIDAVVTGIADSTQSEATGLQEINGAIKQMDRTTQQNAAMVEQSTAACHALARQTEDLSALIRRFQVGDEAKIARTTAEITRPPVSAQPEPRPALKVVAGRGPSTAAATDWQEF